MSLQPSRATGQSGIYTVLLVISALALLLALILVEYDLLTGPEKILSLIYPIKL